MPVLCSSVGFMSRTDLVLSTVRSESKDHLLIYIVFDDFHLISFLHIVDVYSREYNMVVRGYYESQLIFEW